MQPQQTAQFLLSRIPAVIASAVGVIVISALGALTGCQTEGSQTPVLSLEEARKVTAKFDSQSFVPPPRTITDITAILDQQKQENRPSTQERDHMVDAQPPKTTKRKKLAKFYRKRARAAEKSGRIRQAIEDYTTALELSDDLRPRPRAKLLNHLANAEYLGSRRLDALRHLREAIDLNDKTGRVVLWMAKLGNWLVDTGDLKGAEDALEEAELAMGEIVTSRKRGAQEAWRKHGLRMQSMVIRTRAKYHQKRGEYLEAEKYLRSAYAKLTRARLQKNEGVSFSRRLHEHVQANLGLNLMHQGRLVEAEIELRGALTNALKRTGRYGPEVALFSANLASVFAAQGRAKDAEALARASIEINGVIGSSEDSNLTINTRTQLAVALAAQDRWREVLEQFQTIRSSDAEGSEQTKKLVEGNPLYASALVWTGRAADAVPIARSAVKRYTTELGKKHFKTAYSRGVLAVALAKANRKEQALREFSAAIPILLQRSRRSDEENFAQTLRDRRISQFLETYIGVLADVRGTPAERQLGIDAATEAFRIADVARGQSVQRALAASAARAAVKNPSLAGLVRREQDAVKQISALNGLYAGAVSVPTDQRNTAALKTLRVRIDTLRGARAALAQEIEKGFPEYADLIKPKPATVARTRAGLHPDEALILTYVGRDRSFVWAVSKSGDVAFAAVPLAAAQLTQMVGKLRKALDPAAATLGDIPKFDVRLSHRLYSTLLEPVADGWRDAKNLLVVTHGALGQLPFSVLVTKPVQPPAAAKPLFAEYRSVPWLARSHAVTVLPSVAALTTLRKLPAPAPGRRGFIGFGDPAFNVQQAAMPEPADPTALTSRGVIATRGIPLRLRAAPALEGADSVTLARLPRLPDTATEVKSMALAMNADLTRDVFTGAEASEERVKSMNLSGYRVLAFATHGLIPGDLDGLTQPALALSGPKVTGGKDDGLLTMGEILGLKLDADWVVLSACNTASGQGAGAEAVSGLGRAFFYAGTRALLVSNWPVETTSARVLTTDLFRRQAGNAGLGRSESLRQSILSMMDGPGYVDRKSKKTVFSYAHPIFWAPFSLVGDGG